MPLIVKYSVERSEIKLSNIPRGTLFTGTVNGLHTGIFYRVFDSVIQLDDPSRRWIIEGCDHRVTNYREVTGTLLIE